VKADKPGRFGSRAYDDPPPRPAKKAAPKPAKKAAASAVASAPGEVRIIGGAWKRSKLPVPALEGLRPTPDRVRVTLFNWLGTDLAGWRCLDAFAGSGALGFEAASRGAESVVLLERDRRQVQRLDDIRARLGAAAVRVETADALSWMARCAPGSFELVFIDPPFDGDLLTPALAAARRVVVPGGFIYLEAGHAFLPDDLDPMGLTLHRQMRAGVVHAHLLVAQDGRYTSAAPPPPGGSA
jgi:16S rRNA (guanine(966)-N(2))-methyltransferase RsmD